MCQILAESLKVFDHILLYTSWLHDWSSQISKKSHHYFSTNKKEYKGKDIDLFVNKSGESNWHGKKNQLLEMTPNCGLQNICDTGSNLYTFWIKVKKEHPEIAKKALKCLLSTYNILSLWTQFFVIITVQMESNKQHNFNVIVSYHQWMKQACCTKTRSNIPLILHYGELNNYFVIFYSIIIKFTMNAKHRFPDT